MSPARLIPRTSACSDIYGTATGSSFVAGVYAVSERRASTRKRYTPSNTLLNPPLCCSASTHSCRIASPKKTFILRCCRPFYRGRSPDDVAAGGQPPRILVSNGTVRLLESRTGILGCLADTAQPAAPEEVELAPSDRLIPLHRWTHRCVQQSGDMLGVEGLEKLVRQSYTRALPEMKHAILDGVAAWRHPLWPMTYPWLSSKLATSMMLST